MSIANLDEIFKKYGEKWCQNKHNCYCAKVDLQDGEYSLIISNKHFEYYGSANEQIKSQTAVNQILQNGSDVMQEQVVKLSTKTTDTFKWQLTEGIKIGAEAEGKAGVPLVAEGKVKASVELNFSSTQESTKTTEKAWEINQPVKVPPKSTVEATLIVREEEIDQMFRFRCTLSGHITTRSANGDVWHIPVADVFSAKNAHKGFIVMGDSVMFQGNGSYKGIQGVGTKLDIKQKSLVCDTA